MKHGVNAMEFNGLVYVAFSKDDEMQQFHKYMDFDTRPRFPEDLAGDERKLAEEAEFIEYPVRVEFLNARECFYTLNYSGQFDTTNKVIIDLAHQFNAKKFIIFVQNDEEFREYTQFIPGKTKILYSYLSDYPTILDAKTEEFVIDNQFDTTAFKKILETCL